MKAPVPALPVEPPVPGDPASASARSLGWALPISLDTPNPRNISFHRRHGFEVAGEARSGACPPVVSMLRAAR